jgi:hypothetical protein
MDSKRINMKLGQITLGLFCAVLVSISAVRSGFTATLSEFSFNLPWFNSKNVVPIEFSQLSNHDVVLIIDRSHSMLIPDCSALVDNAAERWDKPVSRWQWCHEQALQLAKMTKAALPDGLTLVLFAKTFVTYNNAEFGSIETIFDTNKPYGSTDAAAALGSQIEAYFTKKSDVGERVKPLLIGILSDGCPDNPKLFCDVIVKATQRMSKPGEISITFLQVGNDRRATCLLKQLKNGLLDQNAKFNIVNVITFSELNKIGLPQALVDVASNHSSAQAARMSL